MRYLHWCSISVAGFRSRTWGRRLYWRNKSHLRCSILRFVLYLDDSMPHWYWCSLCTPVYQRATLVLNSKYVMHHLLTYSPLIPSIIKNSIISVSPVAVSPDDNCWQCFCCALCGLNIRSTVMGSAGGCRVGIHLVKLNNVCYYNYYIIYNSISSELSSYSIPLVSLSSCHFDQLLPMLSSTYHLEKSSSSVNKHIATAFIVNAYALVYHFTLFEILSWCASVAISW